jgi:TonB family protein
MPLCIRVTCAIAFLFACVATQAVAAPIDVELQPIREWVPMGSGVEMRAAPDTLLLTAGTIRTQAAFADFVLRFEYRLAAAGTDAELLLRARGAPDGPLDYGYRVALGGKTSGRRPRGRLRADGTEMRAGAYTGPRTPATDGGWVVCEVRAERETLSVSLNGMVVSVADRANAFSGFVAFEAAGTGGIELRGARIASAEPAVDGTRGLPAAGGPGITKPRATHSEQPTYPQSAMRERIAGTVRLEFVIEADGRLGDLRVVVTPHTDLATAAMACVRAWRFTPALKGGAPVAVVATMDVAFKLGK